jgi:type I restriction enzyme S subunit
MKGWEIVTIKDITNNLDNKRIPLNSSQRAEKESQPLYPYIGANNIMGYIDEYIFDEKILCLAEDGGSWGYNQKCAVIYNEKVWVNNHAHVLSAKGNLILEYLMYYLNFTDLNLYINGATRGKLTQSALNSIPISLPPLETQQKIASILDAADTLRQKDKALLAKYDELTQSLFLDMFGDPVSNPKVWEKKTLNELCNKITDGTHDTPKRLTEGIKFITGKHIRPFEIDYINSDYVTEEVHKEIFKRCNPEYGDILYTNIGVNFATAAMNIVDYEFSMKNVALLKYKRDILNGRFLESILNNEFFKDRLKNAFGIGGDQQFLSLSNIKAIQVLCPPIKLQNQFAERVAIIGQQKVQAQASLEKSEELFNSLLENAFKGELVLVHPSFMIFS